MTCAPEEPELPEYDEFREKGIYKFEEGHYPISFEKEVKDPEHHPFPTPSGKIELFSTKLWKTPMKDFMPPIPRYVARRKSGGPLTKRFPLQLSGWHSKCRTHTVHDNNLGFADWTHKNSGSTRKMPPPRSIHDGDMVLVYNDRGQVKIPAKITDRVAKGVATLSQGTWYTPDENGVDTRGSINVLTSQRPTPFDKRERTAYEPGGSEKIITIYEKTGVIRKISVRTTPAFN